MYPKERHKMCPGCDGRIPIDTQLCPYCTTEQSSPSVIGQGLSQHHRFLQESLTAPYAPPYQGKNQTVFPSSKESVMEKKSSPLDTEHSIEEERNVFWPIFLLSMGVNAMILGLLQFFFSDQGMLKLEWRSDYWFLYCLGAIPFVLFGLKKMKTL